MNNSEEELLALHFHRSLDGSWYAVGSFRDTTVGKKGQAIVAQEIPRAKMAKILALLEHDWETKRIIARLDNAADYLDICTRIKDIAWDHPIIERRFTVMDVLRQASIFAGTGELPEEA